jgi:hypothetical protein
MRQLREHNVSLQRDIARLETEMPELARNVRSISELLDIGTEPVEPPARTEVPLSPPTRRPYRSLVLEIMPQGLSSSVPWRVPIPE